MTQLNFDQVERLVRQVATQVVSRFFQTLKNLTDQEEEDYSDPIDYFADRIIENIVREWTEVDTLSQADDALEQMYNAARTDFVKQLQLDGGTVEFGPGDVQPLTDQRLGQSEAWDLWLEREQEQDDDWICVWCGTTREPNWDVYCIHCHARNW